MNERIFKLAIEARKYAETKPDIYQVAYDKKFSELIVQECISTVQKRYMGDNNREDMEVLRCVADMKKHFGVK